MGCGSGNSQDFMLATAMNEVTVLIFKTNKSKWQALNVFVFISQ